MKLEKENIQKAYEIRKREIRKRKHAKNI